MKPTLVAVLSAFLLFLLVRFGFSRATKAGLLSIIPLGIIACLPMIRFRSVNIWGEWYHYFHCSNVDMFKLPISKGNLSLPLFLSGKLGISFGMGMALIAGLLIISFVIRAKSTVSFINNTRRYLADPHFAITLGVVCALALSPLTWVHYFVLLPVPAIILLHPRHVGTPAPKLAILGLLLATPNPSATLPYTIMISWVPLWLAGLVCQLKDLDTA